MYVLHPLPRSTPQSKKAVKQVATWIKAYLDTETDQVFDQWREYMSEDIPEDWYIMQQSSSSDDKDEVIESDDDESTDKNDQLTIYEKIDV